MTQPKERFFFEIVPEFPTGRKWIVTVRDHTHIVRGVVVVANKAGLMLTLEDAIPNDENEIDLTYEAN